MNKNKLKHLLETNKESLKETGIQIHDDHKLPLTRRELLSAGLYSSVSYLALPSFANLLLSSKVLAETGCPKPLETLAGVPLIQLHLSGGNARWTGLAIGLDAGGNPAEYKAPGRSVDVRDFFGFGVSPDFHPTRMPYVSVGGHAAPALSYIYQSGFQYFADRLQQDSSTPSFDLINQFIKTVSFAAYSDDDTSQTPQGVLQSVALLRGTGKLASVVSNATGSLRSGLNNIPMFSVLSPANQAVRVSSAQLADLLNTGLGDVSLPMQRRVMESILSLVQDRILNSDAKKIMGCSNLEIMDKVAEFSSGNLNVLGSGKDPILEKIFTRLNNPGLAAKMYMLKNDLAAAAGINLGGYDYHDQTAAGYQKDYDTYLNYFWPIAHYFYESNRPCIIMVTSDGSVSCNGSIENRNIRINNQETNASLATYSGDRGQNGGTFCFFIAGKNQKSLLPELNFHQAGFGMVGGSASRSVEFAYDKTAYNQVVMETVYRAMEAMSGKKLITDFQQATSGSRLASSLEAYIPIKKVKA